MMSKGLIVKQAKVASSSSSSSSSPCFLLNLRSLPAPRPSSCCCCCFRGGGATFRHARFASSILRKQPPPPTATATATAAAADASHHHHSFTTTRAAQRLLLQTEFQRHGYKLANINPLESHGFLLAENAADIIQESLPGILQPLVSVIARHRNNNNNKSTTSSKEFARAVAAHFIHDTAAAKATATTATAATTTTTTANGDTVLLTEMAATGDLEWCIEKYCASGIGLDFDHVHSEQERLFFANNLAAAPNHCNNNNNNNDDDNANMLLWAYEQLLRTRSFAKLMSERYPTGRRFGIEGLDAAVPALNAIVHAFGDDDDDDDDCTMSRDYLHRGHDTTKRIVLGTQHRGRLDFLTHVVGIPLPDLVQKWDVTDGPTYDDICSGYHRDVTTTTSNSSSSSNNKTVVVHISMTPIPAHLEAMNAVVAGKARAHAVALQHQAPQKSMATTRMAAAGRQDNNDNDDGGNPWNAAAAYARRQVLPVTIHGDASVCGQGIVFETLQLGTCHDYECGGTIRLVLDNQIGFTTESNKIRNHKKHGMTLVSHVGKSIGAPILHVNARLVDDVIRAAQIAVKYRQEFGKDVFLHLWGWREHGHNELDDPHATNIRLYQKMDSQVPVIETFRQRLLQNEKSCITNSVLDEIKAKVDQEFAQVKAMKRSLSWKSSDSSTISHAAGPIKRSLRPKSIIKTTSVDQQLLDEAAFRLTNVPDGFQLHPFVGKVIQARKQALCTSSSSNKETAGTNRVDWATAELLALMTLNLQGIKCRLSGEDVQRGTFFQRHAVWHDISSGKEHHPLAPVEICNSPLSEFGVLSFEYGYSVARPADSLVLWEAQFGDFVNGAQAFLDAVLSSSDEKWGMQSSLTLLLPHGYDGMGPEHSSARLERWLQLFSSHLNRPAKDNDNNDSNNDGESKYKSANMSVTYPSSPSNYFHLLRRQLTWSFRRPLIVLTPKRTLRLAAAASSKSDFLANTFQPVLDDPRMSAADTATTTTTTTNLTKERIPAVLLCSGELYYDLVQLREKSLLSKNVAIVRLEELAPFPIHELNNVLAQYSNVRRVAWVQEEPANQGARDFVLKHLQSPDCIIIMMSKNKQEVQVTCLSRPEAAAPAVGTPRGHYASQEKLMSDILAWSDEAVR